MRNGKPEMCKRIIFTNRKGGVGKTTSVYNLGWYLSKLGFDVLLVDLDPQGNLSKGLLPEEELSEGLYDALTEGTLPIIEVKKRLSLLSGDERLSALEKQLVGQIDGFTRLYELLDRDELLRYRFVLVDSPPSLSMLTTNGLVACEYLISPVNPKLYALQGMNELLSTVHRVKQHFNPYLELLGIIINDHEKRPVISNEIAAEVESAFGDVVFATRISRSIKFEEAVNQRTGVVDLARLDKSRAKEEIELVAGELISRLKMHIPAPYPR
mgnify:CR=1 FL=1